MAKTMEEFSFPQVSVEQDSHYQLSFPHFASSPLWFKSSSSYHKLDQGRRSFSSAEDLQCPDKKSLTEVKDEERMDMLWEDFNEELHQIPFHGRSGRREGVDRSGKTTKLGGKRHGAGEVFCAKVRRPGLMIILKVLKTLLLIQKIRKTRKVSTYHM